MTSLIHKILSLVYSPIVLFSSADPSPPVVLFFSADPTPCCPQPGAEVKGDVSHAQRWNSLEVVKGTFGPDDTVNLIAEIKFEQPIPIRVRNDMSLCCCRILSVKIKKSSVVCSHFEM